MLRELFWINFISKDDKIEPLKWHFLAIDGMKLFYLIFV